MKPLLCYYALVRRDKSCQITDNLHTKTEKSSFSFCWPRILRYLLLHVLLMLVLVSCVNPGSYYCWDEIVSRRDDYVFVTKTDFKCDLINIRNLPYQRKKEALERQNRLEQGELVSSPETIQAGTKLKLRQVYACRTYLVTSILPSYLNISKIQYELERVSDGRFFYLRVHVPGHPLADKEIISPHGSRLHDLALNHEDFKKIFSPTKKGKQRPIRIISRPGFTRKN